MKTCPKCHKIYEDSQNFCSEDGTPLVLTPVSQTLRGETEAPNPPVPAAQPETEQQGQPDSGQGTGIREQQNWQQQSQNGWQQQGQQQQQYQYGPNGNPSFSARFQANIPDGNTWKPMYFSFNGRLNRGTYICRWLVLLLAAVLIGLICGILPFLAPLGYLALLGLFVAQISLAVRRLHDRGHSGFWMFVCVVPALNLLMFLYLLFAESQPGQNEYGVAE